MEPLTYSIGKLLKKGEEGEPVVGMTCDKKHFSMLNDHEIADDGTVTPSVVCPDSECGFHEMIVLEDWNKNGLDNV